MATKKQTEQPDEGGPRGDLVGEPGQGDPNVQAAAAAYADPVPSGEGNGELVERELTDEITGADQ